MLLDKDVDEADLGVEQEKLDPMVMVCDTCGLCETEGRKEESKILRACVRESRNRVKYNPNQHAWLWLVVGDAQLRGLAFCGREIENPALAVIVKVMVSGASYH